MLSRRAQLLLCTLLSSVLILGCQNDTPTGQITPGKVQAKVGDTVALSLSVPKKFDRLQREIWKVEPANLGEVYFDQASLTRREATFRAKEAGTGTIVVQGFLTDPKQLHHVAQIPVTVE
ncbi:MAG TPA: hypothetical protein PLJ27_05155 [Polyangiaceae bacterium]|jgi:hypothetical protein|nr:MAG: hypothetical protein BWY17_00954 [Deltaproteobacteria bacterium ADurb.Bin207]HNS95584.1 hypothetical protein [Polyangiaceae bacterium]HNZ21355.1 hypothetical protein [Polyangiaceae bacterium]HOD24798.1 hypothetical protein [Polyangiaceae bacterium]HOE47470.1 hypothetical protein [Polyangiaceae bacterium]